MFCLYVCAPCASLEPRMSEKAIALGAGVTVSHYLGAGNRTQVLCESCVISPAAQTVF